MRANLSRLKRCEPMHENNLKDCETTNVNKNLDTDRYLYRSRSVSQGIVYGQSEFNINDTQATLSNQSLSAISAYKYTKPRASQSSESETDTGISILNRDTSVNPILNLLSLVNNGDSEATNYESSTDGSDFDQFLSNKKQ